MRFQKKKSAHARAGGKRGVEVLSMNKGDGDLVNFRSYESTTYKYLCRKMETTDQADVRPTHRLAGWLSVWPVAEKHVAERDGELWEGCKEVGEEEEEFGPRRLFTDGTCHRFKIFHGGTYSRRLTRLPVNLIERVVPLPGGFRRTGEVL